MMETGNENQPDAPTLTPWRCTVKEDWIDFNGHMNAAHYMHVLVQATSALYDALGTSVRREKNHRYSWFVLDVNLRYVREISAGADLATYSYIVDFDGTRVHLLHEMRVKDELAAFSEWLVGHVSREHRRMTPCPPHVARLFQAMYEQHKTHPRPEGFGRILGIRRADAARQTSSSVCS